MYLLNDEELKKYRENWIFNRVMRHSCQTGLSKEEALSKVVIFMLDMNDEILNQKIDDAMRSTKPFGGIFSSKGK